MENTKDKAQQRAEYYEAFEYKRSAWGIMLLGAVLAVAGVLWCGYMYAVKDIYILFLHFAPALPVFGLLLCVCGILDNIHQDLVHKQLQDEYYRKYGTVLPPEEDE